MTKKRVLVTGCAGFIGSHIAEEALRRGHEVIGIDDLSAGYRENVPDGVLFFPYDICDIDQADDLMDGVHVVFHNAASKKNVCLTDPARDMAVNGIGTLRLLQAARKHGVLKFVHASTGSVYGEVKGITTEDTPFHPVSYYGVSKMAGESYVQLFHDLYGMNTTILRYFHVYGPRQETDPKLGGVVSIFSDKISRGEGITIHGDGQQTRVFTYVGDIVNANMKAWMVPSARGKVYNCASSTAITIKEMARLLMKHHKTSVSIVHEPRLIGDIDYFNVDSSRIFNDLNVSFRPIMSMYG